MLVRRRRRRVVNGVVFAISTGEFRSGDFATHRGAAAQRGKAAVLWALDAASGKELWSSGNTISSFVRGVGPSAGDGQVYVVTCATAPSTHSVSRSST